MAEQAVITRTQKLARSTLLVMVAFGVTKAISLVQTIIIARVFGVGSEWDAFVTANRVPELIFVLISGGALAHAFIPIFSSKLAQQDKEGAWRIATHVINTIFTTTFLVSVIVFVLAPVIVANVVAPGFDAAGKQQTVELMRILLLSTLIFSVSGICMGILQSHNHFLLPALAPIMFDIGILFGVVFLVGRMGVHGIAVGAVLGAAMHLGIQIPGLFRFGFRWWAELGLRDPLLWKVVRLMLPRIAGLGVFSLNFIVMNNIASRLGTGAVAALDWGWRLMQIPETLIGTAIGTVIFPTLAALSEVGDEEGKRDAMSGALRFILIATIPSAVGLIFVGRPVIALLEGGAFDRSATVLVYSTLRFFALGLVVHSALEVIARSFYADKDTLTPLWAALGGAAINLILSFWLSGVYTVEANFTYNWTANTLYILNLPPMRGNVAGLALANSLGVAFEVGFLLVILRGRWHGANENLLARTVIRTTVASLIMAVAIVLTDTLWTAVGLAQRGRMLTLLQVLVQTGVGAGVFFTVAFVLMRKEITSMAAIILRRETPPEIEEVVPA